MGDRTDFTGQVTVIVGAGNGIGRASLDLLLQRGARVIAVDNNGDALLRIKS
jgi:NAD(P)-dependent dehydrogenase (short-subunit alcohol dehydrogenase family)